MEANRRGICDVPEKYAPQFGGYCAGGTFAKATRARNLMHSRSSRTSST